jgi:nitroreductase
MNDIIQNIVTRRSIRKFQAKQVDEECLKDILLAASYAPNAAGRQSPLIVVCQNKEINDELGRINFSINQQLQKPPVEKADTQSVAAKTGAPVPASSFYGAPTVITLFAPKNWYNFTIDCAVAAQTIQLAAHSLGIDSCIIARALETFETETGKKRMKEWNIDESYEGKIHVLLGYRDAEAPTAKPRQEGHVIRVT